MRKYTIHAFDSKAYNHYFTFTVHASTWDEAKAKFQKLFPKAEVIGGEVN